MTADLQPDLERIIRARDFSALRGKLENWEPADLASLIISLPVEDQVIVFRILPRGLAANVFEYLNLAAQELLLKTLAQNDVAALLNDMAPDDRTHLLDELPATITKQLLSLLTPEERIVAISPLDPVEQARVRRQRHRESKRNAGMVPAEIWLPQAWRDAVIARGETLQDAEQEAFRLLMAHWERTPAKRR
jgi:Mg/Co/Ni transporter MgtE